MVYRCSNYQILCRTRKKRSRKVSCATTIRLFACHTQNLLAYCCSCKHSLIIHDEIYLRSSTKNTLFSNSCNLRPHEPNFSQLALKTNNTLLFRFMLFSVTSYQYCRFAQCKISSSLLVALVFS